MDDEQMRALAKSAAREAIEELMTDLGADAGRPLEMQRDFAFLRTFRTSTETVKRQGLLTATGIIVVAIFGLIWAALTGRIGP